MAQINLKKVFGLELQSNSFTAREGSFERAIDVVVSQDNIVKKRRGDSSFYELGSSAGKSLTEYQDKLVAICEDEVKVFTQNSEGEFSSVATLGGESFTVTSKSRVVESNGNLYFTADQGIMKLEGTTADVLAAGVDSATDIQVITQTKSSSETFFPADSQVAWRVVFGRKDANNNLVLGAPSQLVIATNQTVSATWTQSTTTVTVTSNSHGLATNDVIYVNNANGDTIPDGAYVVTVSSVNVFTFQTNSGTAPSSPTLNWGTYKIPTLEWAIPSGIATTEYIWQLYRSSATASSTISPDESTLQLVDEKNLTSSEISVGFVVYVDETPDILRSAYLYTNPNTGEPRGIAEANEKPPYATDVAAFKNHVFYSNVQTPYTLALSLITANSTDTPDGAEFKITSGVTTRTYIGKAGPKVGNRTVRATSVSNAGATVTITYANHGFNNGDIIAVAQALDSSGAQLATLPQGNYTVANAATNTFDITAPNTPTGLTTLSFAGIETAAGKRIYYIEYSSSSTVAASIDATARAIVRAINRDALAPCYAYYISSVNDIPGRMIFRSKSVTSTFYFNSITSALNTSFSPNLATTGSTVIGTRDDGQGVIYFSKMNRPEAVPLANQLTIGSKSSAILRIQPLRDSLIIIKEDGVYRLNGNDYSSFVATILDNTVACKAADSVAKLNNAVFLVSEKGVVSVSETTATIVSRQIEPLFTAVIGKSYFATETHACAYESESLYLLTTVSPQSTSADIIYCYNEVTSAWTTWTSIAYDSFVKSSDDKLYRIGFDNVIYQERKLQNRLDFCDEDYSATVLTTPSETTATFSVVGYTPTVGDVFVLNDVINRIISVTSDGVDLIYTFSRPFSFEVGNVGQIYKAIRSQLRTSPLTAGDNSIWKQFSEFQSEFRNDSACSRMTIYFLTDSVSGSEETEWASDVQGDGWGDLPWGQFPWGLEEGINSQYETTASQILRIYVPLEASRATFIQVHMTHEQAAENLLLQSMSYTARKYSQRVTR